MIIRGWNLPPQMPTTPQLADGSVAAAPADRGALEAMIAEINSAAPMFRPSKLWDRFARQHAGEIDKYGFAQMKKTFAMNYFNFALVGIFAQSILPALWDWIKRPRGQSAGGTNGRRSGGAARAEVHGFGRKTLRRVRRSSVWPGVEPGSRSSAWKKSRSRGSAVPTWCVYRTDERHPRTSATRSSNIIPIVRGNSVAIDRPIIEIGAGYGRLAYVFVKARPGCKYWIVDLPPALYVSQQYLSAVLPDRKVFTFRHFENF